MKKPFFLMVNTARNSGFYITIAPKKWAKEKEIDHMALTRKLLKGMGLTDEQVDTIIEAHTDTTDGLKAKIESLEADAKDLPKIRKQLETAEAELEAAKKDGWKVKHDQVKKDFDNYKSEIEAKEAKAAKETAVRAYYESKNIVGKGLDIAMRGSREEIDALTLEDGKIKDTAALDALIAGDFSGLVGTTTTRGAKTQAPPASTGGSAKLTKAEIYKKDEKGRYVMSASERQKALAANPDLMR